MASVPAWSQTNRPVFWSTKSGLLDAARNGQLLNLSHANEEDRQKVVASVERILVTEYKVPPLGRDCYQGPFASDVMVVLGGLGAMYTASLSDQPPDFLSHVDLRPLGEPVKERVERIKSTANRDLCDGEAGVGAGQAPYKAAFIQLGAEYRAALTEFFKAEQARRIDRYKMAQARQQQQDTVNRAADQQRQAAGRAAEQQSIDAEAARIRAEQERRAQINKNRVGG